MSFIIKYRTLDKKIRGRVTTRTATSEWIWTIEQLYLNLCSCKWLNHRPRRVIIWITLNIAAVQKIVWLGSNKSKNIIFENTFIVDSKKEFLYKLFLILKRGILSAFVVKYEDVVQVLTYKDIVDFCFFKFCRTLQVFYDQADNLSFHQKLETIHYIHFLFMGQEI